MRMNVGKKLGETGRGVVARVGGNKTISFFG